MCAYERERGFSKIHTGFMPPYSKSPDMNRNSRNGTPMIAWTPELGF